MTLHGYRLRYRLVTHDQGYSGVRHLMKYYIGEIYDQLSIKTNVTLPPTLQW